MTGSDASRPSRTALTRPTCSVMYRALSPRRVANAVGSSTLAMGVSFTLTAPSRAPLPVVGALVDVDDEDGPPPPLLQDAASSAPAPAIAMTTTDLANSRGERMVGVTVSGEERETTAPTISG